MLILEIKGNILGIYNIFGLLLLSVHTADCGTDMSHYFVGALHVHIVRIAKKSG